MIDHRVHRKQPLDSALAQRSRRRRVEEKRILFSQWAEEEGVTVSALLGFLLYLENWNQEKSRLENFHEGGGDRGAFSYHGRGNLAFGEVFHEPGSLLGGEVEV